MSDDVMALNRDILTDDYKRALEFVSGAIKDKPKRNKYGAVR